MRSAMRGALRLAMRSACAVLLAATFAGAARAEAFYVFLDLAARHCIVVAAEAEPDPPTKLHVRVFRRGEESYKTREEAERAAQTLKLCTQPPAWRPPATGVPALARDS